ncbi:hypothetical protein N0V86_007540 [Didymella sp. IMI 355093]|nr:hypothetical protein N0V86_007540 [Didymella sp. IMI 355093]
MTSFDQETNLAILLPSLWDMEDNFTNPDLWRPLESILESWLTMIKKGSIIATSEEDRKTLLQYQAAQEPWVKLPYSATILNETIETFNRLVQAIEIRMPDNPATEKKKADTGLIDEQVLKDMQLPEGFIYTFLLRARRPAFQFIAPGLSLPDSSWLANPAFWYYLSNPASYHDNTTPILLFSASHPYTSSNDRSNHDTGSWTELLRASWHIYSHSPSLSAAVRAIYRNYELEVDKAKIDPNHPFGYPFNKVHEYSAGLYIAPGDVEDDVKLLLPAFVEGDGFAKRSDGCEASLREDVYGVGFTPFAGWGNARLLDVVTHWLEMVESGAWGWTRGALRGIEKWRDADVEETAGAYVLPMPVY